MSSDEVQQIIQNAIARMRRREQLSKILLKTAMLRDRVEEVKEGLSDVINGIEETLKAVEEFLEAMKDEQ